VFTGLIQEVGQISDVRPRGNGRDLVVRALGMASDLTIGESIAVNGVCLTVEAFDGSTFRAHAGEETLGRSTLSEVRVGSRLNLERALLPGQRLGGHFVQGHVDGVGVVRGVRPSGTTTWFEIDAPPELSRHIAPKVSIAVDGISLTVVECRGTSFSVAIIPHTLAQTNLGERRPGDRVNLETDVLAKYVERLLAAREDRPGLTEAFLREHGF
jgi:riboflavin synthase